MNPKIYHLTHVDNLQSIVAAGELIPEASIVQQGVSPTAVAMSRIKQRRLGLPITCRPGVFAGHRVPFYLCPGPVMHYPLPESNRVELL